MNQLCTHFGECGGCAHQDVAYAEQCAVKSQALTALLDGIWDGAVPVEPSPSAWFYRNKIDLNFAGKHYETPPPKGFEREAVLGFKKKNRWYWTLDIGECRIAMEWLPELLTPVREWVRGSGLTAFDSRNKGGMLKGLIVREGKRTGERMAVLVTRPGEVDADGFRDAVLEGGSFDSVQWAVDESLSPALNSNEIHGLHGRETIEERLEVPGCGRAELRFCISPFSFFQTNTLATEVLYGAVREMVLRTNPQTVYDLYGGGGGIAFSVADGVHEVISVESIASATADGRFNAGANGINNVRFHTEPVEKYLRGLVEGDGLADDSVAVLDPPRSGLHPKALRRLIRLAPREIVYVSCKPSVFVQEWESLGEHYRVEEVRAVDLFPHTDHVELVLRLVRK